jgi:hypothetical protein
MAEVCVPQETNIEALLTIWGSDMEHLRAELQCSWTDGLTWGQVRGGRGVRVSLTSDRGPSLCRILDIGKALLEMVAYLNG